ncbi:MAG: rhodanese-like domain-containing protein [Acidobacteriaceae bacterium]
MSLVPFVILAITLVALYVTFRRSNQASLEHACEYLRRGALLVDVRSPSEFRAGHLPRAINLPLNELESLLPRHTRDKQQVILLHCQSGMRSGLATKRLKSQGYVNTFNLGSYSRASRLVREC